MATTLQGPALWEEVNRRCRGIVEETLGIEGSDGVRSLYSKLSTMFFKKDEDITVGEHQRRVLNILVAEKIVDGMKPASEGFLEEANREFKTALELLERYPYEKDQTVTTAVKELVSLTDH